MPISLARARRNYLRLCDDALREGHLVKLSRLGEGWGLQILVRPEGSCDEWLAAGVFFRRIEELGRHASCLLEWARMIVASR